jgi:hypothetical protein
VFGKRRDALLGRLGYDPALLKMAAGKLQAATAGPEAIAYRERLERVTAGAEMAATVRAFTVGETATALGGLSTELQLTVEPPGASPYEVQIDQVLPAAVTQTLAAGQRLTVKVAPDDPQCVMLWNTPHAAGGADPDTGQPLAAAAAPTPAPSSADRIARLEKLGQLRASGVLTDEEFEAQKAKILGA